MSSEPPSMRPLDAVPEMRTTAKWTLAAAAAVGAALIGTSPLAAAGRIHGAGAAVAAYAGLVVGLAGVGWAIWHTAEALIPPLTTPRSLDSDPRLSDLRAQIAGDPAAFYGPFGTSMADVLAAKALHQRVATSLTVMLADEQDSDRKQTLQLKLAEANTAVGAASSRVQTLLELGHAWCIRTQLRRARLHTFVGAALAALGVVIFVTATSTSTATNTPAPAPSVTHTAP
ncbi:hypothetical protein ACH47V_25505 [Micromonospora chersina]|uniref:hypothetical protein n=1 Tax=Micromonospora chersina TaxID=47854 RepID=UPI0033FDE7B9